MQMRSLRGKNIVAAGWEDGRLRAQFAKSGEYIYAGVPEEKFVSLCRVPYPDKYFTQSIKGQFPSSKVPELGQIYDDRESYYTTANRELDEQARNAIAVDTRKEERNDGRRDQGMAQDIRAGRCDSGGGESANRDSGATCGTQPNPSFSHPSNERSRVMETFGPPDVEFHETDANGQPAHFYTLNGVRIPFSLTQVLELSGIARQPISATEIAARPAAAKRGTKVHEYTLWADQGELDLDDLKAYPEYYNRVIGWQQFCEDFDFAPDLTHCEVPLAVRVNGMLYGFKADAYGVIGEGENLAMAVVEKKCTANDEASHAIQTAGQALYFKSHAESVQIPLKRFVVYLLDKQNGGNRFYRAVECTERGDERIFIGAGLTNCYWRLQHGLLNGAAK